MEGRGYVIHMPSFYCHLGDYMGREGSFQAKLIKKIKELFPGCMVLKNDPDYMQGVPDLLILYNDKWASLEVKASASSKHRPNQDYYVDKMNTMSYSAFVSPENERQVLDALCRALC